MNATKILGLTASLIALVGLLYAIISWKVDIQGRISKLEDYHTDKNKNKLIAEIAEEITSEVDSGYSLRMVFSPMPESREKNENSIHSLQPQSIQPNILFFFAKDDQTVEVIIEAAGRTELKYNVKIDGKGVFWLKDQPFAQPPIWKEITEELGRTHTTHTLEFTTTGNLNEDEWGEIKCLVLVKNLKGGSR